MGDRANVIIKTAREQVCLYTHWQGYELPGILRAALIRGKERWRDFQYLTRIIFCEMIRGSEESLTGFGITQVPHDGERQLLTIDIDSQTVAIGGGESMTFEGYISKECSWAE